MQGTIFTHTTGKCIGKADKFLREFLVKDGLRGSDIAVAKADGVKVDDRRIGGEVHIQRRDVLLLGRVQVIHCHARTSLIRGFSGNDGHIPEHLPGEAAGGVHPIGLDEELLARGGLHTDGLKIQFGHVSLTPIVLGIRGDDDRFAPSVGDAGRLIAGHLDHQLERGGFVLDSRGRLTSYSSDDGSVNWESGDALTDLRLRSQSDPLVIGDEYVLLGQSNGKVNVILQSTGSIVNQIDVGEPYGANALERVADVSATPLVIGSTLYSISYGGGLVQYSFENNQVLSRLNYQSSKDLAIDDSSIVIVGDNGHVYCLNRSDNSERWVNTVLTYRSVSAPAIYGDYVVVGDLDGYLYFMSLNDGTIVCQHEVDDSAIYTAPLVADGNLYVSTRDGDLTAYKYDPNGNAMVKELAVNELLDYAGAAVNMARPGVGEGGIYAPSVMDKEQLQARRAAILRAAAEAEARQKAAIAAQRRAYEERRRAYEAQKRAYEERVREYKARVAAYEEEQRRRLSGFGLMPGVKSNADAVPEEPATEAPKAPEVSAPETPVQEVPEMNMPKENPEEKASGFGL